MLWLLYSTQYPYKGMHKIAGNRLRGVLSTFGVFIVSGSLPRKAVCKGSQAAVSL